MGANMKAIVLLVLLACELSLGNAKKTAAEVVEYWTSDRRKNAVPRDIVINEKTKKTFIRGPKGEFIPYGQTKKNDRGSRELIRGYHSYAADVPSMLADRRGEDEAHRKLQPTVGNGAVPDPTPNNLKAVGRLFFDLTSGSYSCSGTAVNGGTGSDSYIATAAHCIYDENNDDFAHDVMFIPNQDDGNDAADIVCSNDPYGCWVPSFAVIHGNYLNYWKQNDFGVYVVKGNGANSHFSSGTSNDRPISEFLDLFDMDFANAPSFATGYGFPGYSRSDFRYCQGPLSTTDIAGSDNYWLNGCTLGGGTSGGSIVPYESRDIISVISYQYCRNWKCTKVVDGMGATPCDDNSGRCQCVWNAAQTASGNLLATGSNCVPGTIPNPVECGDGKIEGAEVCDSDTVDCTSLDSSSYAGGSANCNSNCDGYDADTCTPITPINTFCGRRPNNEKCKKNHQCQSCCCISRQCRAC